MSRKPNTGKRVRNKTTLSSAWGSRKDSSSSSLSVVSNNPRYSRGLKKKIRKARSGRTIPGQYDIQKSLKIMSVDDNQSVISISSSITGDKEVEAADQQVQRYLDAKKHRKQGELVGPSVAMQYYNERKKTNAPKGTKLFRKFLPSSRKTKREDFAIKRTGSVKSKGETEFILEALRSVLIFKRFADSTFHTLARSMYEREYEAGTVICKEGEFSDEMFILQEGEVVVTKATQDSKKKSSATSSKMGKKEFYLTAGASFGELGMNYGSPRQRTITATKNCRVYVLKRSDYHNIVQSEFLLKKQMMNDAVQKVQVLDTLPPEQLDMLLDRAELVSFPANTKIIEQGTLGGTFYMIASGKVNCIVYEQKNKNDQPGLNKTRAALKSDIFRRAKKVEDDDNSSVATTKHNYKKKVYEFGVGEYFGERALLQNNHLRKADVVAKTDVELLAIAYDSIADVTDLVGLKKAFQENIKKQALGDTPFFDNLTIEEEEQLEKALVLESFKDGEHIIDEGIENNNFYLIVEGFVEIRKNLNSKDDFEIAQLGPENYFGEGSLLLDKKTNASVIAKGNVSCYVLSKEKFVELVKGEKLKLIKDTFNERNRKLLVKSREKKNEYLANTTLDDLRTLTNLGSGCFGLVKLVEVKDMNAFFALKTMEKGAVVENNQQVNVMNEKKILLSCDHPFIVKLYRTFKDAKYLYFLLEFIQGGEMFQFLHHERNGYLDNDTAKFFVACVVDALDYLHKKRVVYRDLKPENLMIDLEGYTKVVDFGFAKKCAYRTFTVCGTAQYLAPEILFHRGYGRSVDFWTLGILIFELFTGSTPFKRDTRNEMFEAIKTENRIKFNRRWRGADAAKEIVCLLLHKHPKKRLGCNAATKRGFKQVKQHRWFDSIDFQKLYFKEIEPPWIPKVKADNDYSHFEEYDEDDNPLTGKYDKKAGSDALWKDF